MLSSSFPCDNVSVAVGREVGGRCFLILHGRRERGQPSDGAFKPRTGEGYVAPAKGQYTRAEDVHGCDVRTLLFSVFGGFSGAVVDLLEECAQQRQNKLRKDEYDVTTWSARTWLTFSVQKVSVALHRAVALELAHGLGLSAAVAAR